MKDNNYFYQPAEDSYFLAEIVSSYLSKIQENIKKEMKVLDMGTGSGIQAKTCIDNGIKKSNIYSVDINAGALREARKLGVRIIKSDLFYKLNKEIKYDLVIFNPPYLPESKHDKRKDTTGGKYGDETIIKFLSKLKNYMEKEGVCFLLTSSLTPHKKWMEIADREKLSVTQLSSKKIFQEALFIWKITY